MPVKNLTRRNEEGIYSHIYNKGVEKRIIFNDEEDYEVFKGFLKDYLTTPKDPESIKTAFTVHGRVFRGTPHQPKNYCNKVELIAYSLMPNHFHLLLNQKTHGSLESFIRSLCTRYSIYFNKKYRHTGALFEGPYKSAQIKNEPGMLHLTRYFHHAGDYSSYAEYLGSRVTSWVKPKVVQSFFDTVKIEADSYKDFVEKYESDQKEQEELIGNIIFETETQHLERRNPPKNVDNSLQDMPTEFSEEIHADMNLRPLQRIPEIAVITLVFLVLVTVGIRNTVVSTAKSPKLSTLGTHTVVSTAKSPKLSPTPSVPSASASATTSATASSATATTSAEIEKIKPKIMVTIKINDGATFVNIRQKPITNSEKIGKAKDGDTFEFISIDSGWYGVKLADGSTGFISATYVMKGGTNE